MTELGSIDIMYTGIEANTIFYDPVFRDADLLAEFRVMPNVVNEKKMQFVTKLEKILRRYSGCGFTPIPGFNIYDRKIKVEKVKVDLALCADEFFDTIFEELLNRGTAIHDLTGTLIETILIDKMREGIQLDVQRVAYFADRSNPDPNYDQLDGLWTVHYPYLATNDLAPYTDSGSGAALGAGDGIALLKAVYDRQALELRGLPDSMKKFNVTGSVWNQYREDIENGGGGDYGLLTVINGVEVLKYRGIEIRPNWRWDDIMTNDLGSADSHLVELTVAENKILATDLVNPGEDFLIWYDPKEEKLFAKTRFKLGVNYVHPRLLSFAY